MKPRNIAGPAVVVLAVVLTAACANKNVRKPSASAPTNAPSDLTASSQNEPPMRDATLISVPELKNVYFSFDSDRLSAESEKTLAANAEFLKENPKIRVQVAGNCDQRGTIEYNIALGQRRAAAVRSYYKMMGIAGSRVATISYGKERPVCSQMTESCWQKNRRAETLEAVSQNISSTARFPGSR